MSMATDMETALHDPRLLEDLYQKAVRLGSAQEFVSEIARRYRASPDNVLLAAWHYRLQALSPAVAAREEERGRRVNWPLAVGLSLVLALIYRVLFDECLVVDETRIPYLMLVWAPVAACLILVFLTAAARAKKGIALPAALIGITIVLTAYAAWMARAPHSTYRGLMIIHLPLLAWVAVGWHVVGGSADDRNRFAFLIKSAEAMLTGAIYGGAAAVFGAVTIGLFQAIGVQFSDHVMRWLGAGVAGMIPVLAVASVYDPDLTPSQQRFDQGLARLIFTAGRIFLPLTLIVGVIYIAYIPANFMKPFEQREVLIVYNLMLFAVMAQLIFATPLNADDVAEKTQTYLRTGIVVVAILTVLVSLYALSATVYRTYQGGITINRLTIIGWNVINIGILCLLLYRQWRNSRGAWVESCHWAFRLGMVGYAVWTVFLVVAIPLLFP